MKNLYDYIDEFGNLLPNLSELNDFSDEEKRIEFASFRRGVAYYAQSMCKSSDDLNLMESLLKTIISEEVSKQRINYVANTRVS